MEGTHGELSTGFPNGLGGDGADGFSDIHHGAGGEIAPVTFFADAVTAFTGQHGAYANFPFFLRQCFHIGFDDGEDGLR